MTLAQFIQTLAAIDVGQKATFAYPPTSLNAADLPALWVELPRTEEPLVSLRGAVWAIMRARVVVAMMPVSLDAQEKNFHSCVEMCDQLANVLHSVNVCDVVLRASVSIGVVEVAGTAFWAVIADVEGHG